MSESNQHINYSAADIEKYWKGQLSAAEQHAMEKAALDDPFLADAMDGYEEKALVPEPIIAADIDELKKRLAERTTKKESTPVIKFGWWKVAAVLIVFAGAAWLYTAFSIKAKVESIAKNDELAKEVPLVTKTDTVSVTTGAVANDDTFHDVAVNKYNQPAAKDKITNADKDEETESSLIAPAPAALPVTSQSDIAKKTDTSNAEKDIVAKSSEAKTERYEVIAAKPEQKAAGIATDDYKANNNEALAARARNFSNTFSGKITDQSNQPVANAAVQIPNLNVATQTDKRGDFSFMAQDTGLSVSIASDGFETQNFHLRNNNAVLNQIVLTPVQNTLKEVVVQSNGAEKRKQSAAKDISIKILDAEPFIGWTAYNEYLEKNKKVKEDAQHIHGTVIVSFQVHNKLLNNFRIEQSLDNELDAEAIRLIKEGPAWKLLKGKKANTTVTVRF